MKKSKFSLAREDEELVLLVNGTDHITVALWAIDCAERVMPYFEEKYPQDHRPRLAIETLKRWIDTGEFRMAVIRKASLDAHAAAREVGDEIPARSAAHAAGQAVATAHVPRHAYGPAIYAQQAVYRAANPADADAAVAKEREWQYYHLLAIKAIHRPLFATTHGR
jgi:immunity protein 5 of polymorphic toxin system